MAKEMGFLIALCAASAVRYALLTRADRIRAERRLARRQSSPSSDGGLSASSDSWSLASWFSGSDSSCSYDSSGNPTDFGSCGSCGSCGDSGSGGGGDCGGGGGGID